MSDTRYVASAHQLGLDAAPRPCPRCTHPHDGVWRAVQDRGPDLAVIGAELAPAYHPKVSHGFRQAQPAMPEGVRGDHPHQVL